MKLGCKRWLLSLTLAVAVCVLAAAGTDAATVLLYDDFDATTGLPADTTALWRVALDSIPGLSVTQVSSDADFLTSLAFLGPGDLVVAQFAQDHNGITPAHFTTFRLLGGKIIFSSWTNTYDTAFPGVQQSVDPGPPPTLLEILGTTELTLTRFADGLTTSQPVLSDGSGNITPVARVLDNPPGTLSVAGTLTGGSPGIVVSEGQFIVNAFQGDTFVGPADEVLLYRNEVLSLVAVPEPTTLALVGTGLIAVAGLGHWRRTREKR